MRPTFENLVTSTVVLSKLCESLTWWIATKHKYQACYKLARDLKIFSQGRYVKVHKVYEQVLNITNHPEAANQIQKTQPHMH